MKNILSKVGIFSIFTFLSLSATIGEVFASEILEITIIIKDHKFEPDEIKIPKDTKIRLIVKNMDESVEEFDSPDLKREKIIPGGGEVRIILAPLKAGRYEFIGEFHQETAKGVIVAE